jgi:hypothetical protein
MGRPETAKRDFDQALTLDPSNAGLRRAMEMEVGPLPEHSPLSTLITAIIIALLPSFALAQQPLPKPFGPGGSCPHGYTSSGSFCVPRAGAQDAIAVPPNGGCPHGWTRSGSFCLRSGSGR